MNTVRIGSPCVEVLPRTTSGKARSLRWVPLSTDEHGCDGALTVSQENHKVDRVYLVTEYVPDSPWHGRAFVCRRAGAVEPYHVFISADHESQDTCDCAAGSYRPKSRCIHIEAIRAVLANPGWLPCELGSDAPWSDPVEDPFQ